jgi:4-hydroxyphenylacetate decarboxylase small subunit
MKLNHNDCLNFCSIDAAKGICRLSKQTINIDSDICNSLVLAPKCNNCIHFDKPDDKGIGTCKGLEKEDWTFGGLCAVTCKAHEFKRER